MKNGKKSYGVQNYLCKKCKRQFVTGKDRKYKRTIEWFVGAILRALVRGSGIRDIAIILEVSVGKALKTLLESSYELKPAKNHYAKLEVDELWTFVGAKSNRKWLISAYNRDDGEIAAYVLGDRSAKTANRLRQKLKLIGVFYDYIATDDWGSFVV